MWVFDGEHWINEDAPPQKERRNVPATMPELGPELEIVELPVTDHRPPPPAPVSPRLDWQRPRKKTEH